MVPNTGKSLVPKINQSLFVPIADATECAISKEPPMRNHLVPLFLALVLFAPAASAGEQETHKGNVTIESAADWQQLKGVNILDGDLIIMGFAGKDLKGYPSGLHTITGMVVVFSNPNLENLEGMERLAWVHESFRIFANPKLKNLKGLKSLKSVWSGFSVTDNPAMTALLDKGFQIGEPIKGKRGFLQITDNTSLPQSVAEAFGKSCKTQQGALYLIKDNKK
jgi:hypothetical protein